MNLPVRYHPLAEDELVAAWTRYERLQPGLGDRFVVAVRLASEQATQWPNSGQAVYTDDGTPTGERRIPTPEFPYAIRYRILDEMLLVTVIHHQQRHPSYGDDR